MTATTWAVESGITPERAAIVAALGTVPGLNPTPTVPGPVMPGSAWPVWVSASWLNVCVTRSEWFVFVALPGAPATVDSGDSTITAVADALWPLGKLTRVEPWAWPVEPGQQAVPVLRFTMEV